MSETAPAPEWSQPDKPITAMSDDELEEGRMEIEAERSRRQSLKGIPEAIADWARQYQAAGGDPEDLVQVIREPDPAEGGEHGAEE